MPESLEDATTIGLRKTERNKFPMQGLRLEIVVPESVCALRPSAASAAFPSPAVCSPYPKGVIFQKEFNQKDDYPNYADGNQYPGHLCAIDKDKRGILPF